MLIVEVSNITLSSERKQQKCISYTLAVTQSGSEAVHPSWRTKAAHCRAETHLPIIIDQRACEIAEGFPTGDFIE